MSSMGEITQVLAKHVVRAEVADDGCLTGNDYDGRLRLRIASIFIIWVGATAGTMFPIFAHNNRNLGVPGWVFFIAKFFGSGVIVATAFIHLLSPAEDALRNPCLTGPITDYDWVSGIALMTIFVLFFVELMVMRFAGFEGHHHEHEHSGHVNVHTSDTELTSTTGASSPRKPLEVDAEHQQGRSSISGPPGEDHYGHARTHNDIEEAQNPLSFEDYKAQLTAIFILEFGIIFHSIFIGLTLAVSGDEFITLFIVIIFHQTFEGLGLGTRLAVTPWPRAKTLTPYLLAAGYGVSTPIAIAVGLGVRNSYPPQSATTLIVNGVFDSISAGILIYTGLVELMAHEFIFSDSMRKASIKTLLGAFFTMCVGAGLMALLGKWA